MAAIEVKVPDIGDFSDVPVIEVFVKPGDSVKAEDSLITLESDKATMDVPSPAAGTVAEIKLKDIGVPTRRTPREPAPGGECSHRGSGRSRPAGSSRDRPARECGW